MTRAEEAVRDICNEVRLQMKLDPAQAVDVADLVTSTSLYAKITKQPWAVLEALTLLRRAMAALRESEDDKATTLIYDAAATLWGIA